MDTYKPLITCCYIHLAGVEGFSIFFKETGLPGGRTYRLVAEGWTPGSEVAVAEHQFKVNLLPYGGSCDVSPRDGNMSPIGIIICLI